jgi:hypothetical protein
MEINQLEVSVIEDAVNNVLEKEFRDLYELQLAYLGGGIGEVIVA